MGNWSKRITHIEGCAKLKMNATLATVCTCRDQRKERTEARIVRGRVGHYGSLGEALPGAPGCYITPSRRCPS